MAHDTTLTGEDRCWPCTVANTVVGVVVAGVPAVAALLAVAGAWAVAVLAYTFYRLLVLGYLPYSETIARRTGLHERLGPDDERD